MPCYLFTWHAYGTWMPDRAQGFVKKGQGILATDTREAERYRLRQVESCATYDDKVQQILIEELQATAKHRRFCLHSVATDATHVHILLSWDDERPFEKLRRGVRESLTRRLNQHERRRWLAAGGSRKRVKDQSHFDHLVTTYLPKHRGWKWCERRGLYR